MPSPLGWGRTRARWAAQKTRQDSSSLGSAARRLGQKDASETHSEQTRGAWRVPRGSGLVHRLVRAHDSVVYLPTMSPSGDQPQPRCQGRTKATVRGLGPRWRNCARAFATNPCNAKRFTSRMLRESSCWRGLLRGFKLGVDVATARWGFYPSASTTACRVVRAVAVLELLRVRLTCSGL